MNKELIYNKLSEIVPKDNIKVDEPMKNHITFRVGGPADFFIEITTIQQLKKILGIISEYNIPYRIIGNGSNILVKDEGFRGIILKDSLNNIEFMKKNNEAIVKVSSGVKLSVLGQKCANEGIKGFEFATGIPGTIGGAVRMNAGAHGMEMKDIIKDVTYLDSEGNINIIRNSECEFEYRNSLFGRNKYIVLEATLELDCGDKQEIKQLLKDYANYRIEKQPIELPNAGSTFKRGDDFITAKLIDDAGLKGYTVGGAQVSIKHAGFVVNFDNATATDILEVIKHVQETVYEKFQKKIELEVEII